MAEQLTPNRGRVPHLQTSGNTPPSGGHTWFIPLVDIPHPQCDQTIQHPISLQLQNPSFVLKMGSLNGGPPQDTGGKGWWPGLVHHKSITRTWTKYQAKTHLVHLKSIQNVPSQFPCSVPGSGNGWYIHSVPGHVTRVSPSGTPWEHSKFSQRKYPEFS